MRFEPSPVPSLSFPRFDRARPVSGVGAGWRRLDAAAAGGLDRQTTLARPVVLEGVGVHSGHAARLTLRPAAAQSGLRVARTDLPGAPTAPAVWSHVAATALRTALRIGAERLSTIEHVTAALAGLGVDNALIEIDGPEAPILDGSCAPLVAAIDAAGLRLSAAPRRRLVVLKTVRVRQGPGFAELAPSPDPGLTLDVAIDYAHPAIGRQRRRMALTPEAFRTDLAAARTFGFLADVEGLRRQGFARGASLDNTVALDAAGVANAEGFRFADECVRHKMLDAVGDLALAGAPLQAVFRSVRGGHALNHAALAALFADSAAYRLDDAIAGRNDGARRRMGPPAACTRAMGAGMGRRAADRSGGEAAVETV